MDIYTYYIKLKKRKELIKNMFFIILLPISLPLWLLSKIKVGLKITDTIQNSIIVIRKKIIKKYSEKLKSKVKWA